MPPIIQTQYLFGVRQEQAGVNPAKAKCPLVVASRCGYPGFGHFFGDVPGAHRRDTGQSGSLGLCNTFLAGKGRGLPFPGSPRTIQVLLKLPKLLLEFSDHYISRMQLSFQLSDTR
jgi:hypothetical protein